MTLNFRSLTAILIYTIPPMTVEYLRRSFPRPTQTAAPAFHKASGKTPIIFSSLEQAISSQMNPLEKDHTKGPFSAITVTRNLHATFS